MEANVRKAIVEDVGELAELFDLYRQFYNQESDKMGAKDFLRERIENAESIIFVAYVGGNISGFCQLYPTFSSQSMQRSWVLNDLFVHSSVRKHGLGRMLLEAAEVHAIQTKSKGLVLCTQLTNTSAQSLYESFGFAHLSEYKWYFKAAVTCA